MHLANVSVDEIGTPRNAALRRTTTPRDPEKQSLNIANTNPQPNNMPRIQYLCFTLLVLALLGLTIVSAASNQQGNGISDAIVQEKLRFQQLLNSVEPSSLHEVLHTHMKDRYKHGVYQEDKHAMEVVHQENAVVAHSLLELAKRQTGGNGTTVVVISTTAVVNTETTTTATQVAAPTTTTGSPPPPTTSPSSPAASPSTSPQSPQVQQTSSPSVEQTSSTPLTSTNVKSTTFNKATPAASRSVTQQILYTSTLPGGGVTTITSLTVIPADQAQTAGGGTSTNSAKASLQTNSARSAKAFGISGVLGALGLIVVVAGL